MITSAAPWDDGLPEEREIIPYLQRPPSTKVIGADELVAVGQVLAHKCHYCGHKDGVVTEGKGPHAAGLNCLNCDRHLHWFAHSQVIK